MIKLFKRIVLILILLAIAVPILALGYLGYIPGLSSVLGANKPRDLGIRFTEEDFKSGRQKSSVELAQLPPETPIEKSFQTTGSRPITAEFTSQEISALMNNRPWRYWPYKNVQVKFNGDGSGEISGVLIKSNLPAYGVKIGAPKEAVDFAIKVLPPDPAFYVKGRAELTENKIVVFEPQSFSINKISFPVEMFLSFLPPRLVKEVSALSPGDLVGELSQVQNKRALIIGYINDRLTKINGFYAKNAYFTENNVVFDGMLPEKELTTW